MSGNSANGVAIGGAGTDGTIVQGNYIGTDNTGAAAIPNLYPGVAVFGGATNTQVGGLTATPGTGAGNVISGNKEHGVMVTDVGTSGTVVRGNLVGLAAGGEATLGNGTNGSYAGVVVFDGASNTTIGGTDPLARNVVSGNENFGIATLGSGGLIVTNTLIEGNYVGTDLAGTVAIPNGRPGIGILDQSANTTVGGNVGGAGNLVSGNAGGGVLVANLFGTGAPTVVVIQGNLIGINATGTAALANTASGSYDGSGIKLQAVSGVLVGGTTTTARNVISGNSNDGVEITGSAATGNVVEGNYIGINAAGSAAVANATGVQIDAGATNNAIGGTSAGAGNVISGNAVDGVQITGSGTTGNIVEGNYIGADAGGGTSSAYQFSGGGVTTSIPQLSLAPLAATTVSFWMNWDGSGDDMPISFANTGHVYDLELFNGYFGFNTHNGDIYGIEDTGLANSWHLITAVFVNSPGTLSGLQLWIDGVQQALVQEVGTTRTDATVTNAPTLSQSNFPFSGSLAQVAFFNGQLPPTQIVAQYDAAATGGYIATVLSQNPAAYYVLNQVNGSAAADSSPNRNDGIISGGVSLTSSGPPILGGGSSVGNSGSGISISGGAASNAIGGTTAGARNIISGNAGDGVQITGSGTTGNVVEGNYIGLAAGVAPETVAGAVGVWRADGTEVDASGNGNAATLINGVNYTGGHEGLGWQINGTTNGTNQPQITVADSNSLDLTQLTIGAWINVGALPPTTGDWVIADKGVTGSSSNYGLYLHNTGAGSMELTFEWYNGIFRHVDSVGAQYRSGRACACGGYNRRVHRQVLRQRAIHQPGVPDERAHSQFGCPLHRQHRGIGLRQSLQWHHRRPGHLQPASGRRRDRIHSRRRDCAGQQRRRYDQRRCVRQHGRRHDRGARNAISGNTGDGVNITGSGTTGNFVEGNFIGLDAAGTAAVANATGVLIDSGATNNTLGGTTAAARNVISGNVDVGVYLSSAGSGNQVSGNYIGTDATGTSSIPNVHGIVTHWLTGTVIGGLTDVPGSGPGNVISGNSADGISPDIGVQVIGNLVGTDQSGTQALGNGTVSVGGGIHMSGDATGLVIGGTDPLAKNVIAGNPNVGVWFEGGNNGVLIGNFVGLDVSGTHAIPQKVGIVATGVLGVQITGNVVAGSQLDQVEIGLTTSGISIKGNLIGTDRTGSAIAIGDIPASSGIKVSGTATGLQIGGAAAGEGNVVSGSNQDGIVLSGASITGAIVQGNRIGTDATGFGDVGNTRDGLVVDQGQDITIGGTTLGTGNTIAYNDRYGVRVVGATAARVSIRGNSIFANTNLGIDLGGDGVTLNSANTNGPNGFTHFPVLSAGTVGPQTHVVGTLSAITNTTYAIDFFASDTANPSGFGGGQIYLGSTSVTTNGSGQASFDIVLPVETGADQVITMTATDAAGNTSEFSQVRRSNATPFLDAGDLNLTGVSVSPTISITQTDAKTGDQIVSGSSAFGDGAQITVHGSFTDGTAGNLYTAVIDWADGSQTTLPVTSGVAFSASHTYPAGVDSTFVPTVQLLLTQTTLGTPVTLRGEFEDADLADTHTVTVNWGDGTTSTVANASLVWHTDTQLWSFQVPHAFADSSSAVTVTVADQAGASASASIDVNIGTVAPTFSLAGSASEGGPGSVSFSVLSGNAAGYTYSFDFNNDGVFEVVNSASLSAAIPASYIPDGPAILVVHGQVTDKHGVSTDYPADVAIANVAPTLSGLTTDRSSYLENDTVTLTGTIAEPGRYDSETVEIDWNDGTPHTFLHLLAGQHVFQARHQYLNDPAGANDAYAVNVTVTDKDGDTGAAIKNVVVINAAPNATILAGSSPTNPSETVFTSSGSDVGTQDVLSYHWTVTNSDGSQTLADQSSTDLYFTPTAGGIYHVTLRVTDSDGGSGTDSALVVAGSDQDDTIHINPGTLSGSVQVVFGAIVRRIHCGQPGDRRGRRRQR